MVKRLQFTEFHCQMGRPVLGLGFVHGVYVSGFGVLIYKS